MIEGESPEAPLPAVIAARGATIALAARERLARQGDVPRYMYCVVKGEVRLTRVGHDGALFILQRVRRGWVAEASLFVPRYHCDLLAAEESTLVRVAVSAVRAALEDSATFRRYWVGCMAREIRRLRGACERLALRSAEDRVLHAIESEGEAGTLRYEGTLKDWAAELGLTHEALYRALARLERAGTLRRAAGALVLTPAAGNARVRGRPR